MKCEECGFQSPCYYTNAKIRRLQKEQKNARKEGKVGKANELFDETKRRMDELKERMEKGGNEDG